MIILACKMTDDGETGPGGRNKNLTLDYFLNSENVASHPRYSEMKDIYQQQIKPARKELQEARNKYVAHQDLPFSREMDKHLPGFKHIDVVINGVDKVYRLLKVIITGNDIHRGPTCGGASYVFHILDKALKDK